MPGRFGKIAGRTQGISLFQERCRRPKTSRQSLSVSTLPVRAARSGLCSAPAARGALRFLISTTNGFCCGLMVLFISFSLNPLERAIDSVPARSLAKQARAHFDLHQSYRETEGEYRRMAKTSRMPQRFKGVRGSYLELAGLRRSASVCLAR